MALTEWHDLLQALEEDPQSDILAAMLTDELMESRGMARNEADRYVELARVSARQALDVKWATELIVAKGPAFHALVSEVRTLVGIYATDEFTMFVIPGEGRPEVLVPADVRERGAIYRGFPVSLPASWVRFWWGGECLPIHPPRIDPHLLKRRCKKWSR